MSGLTDYLPGPKDEAWRFTSVRKLFGDEPAPVSGALGSLPQGARPLQPSDPVGTIASTDGLPGLSLAVSREGALIDGDVALTLHGREGLATPRLFVAGGDVHVDCVLDAGLLLPVIEVHAAAGAEVHVLITASGRGDLVSHVAIRGEPDSRVHLQTVLAGGRICRAEVHAELARGARLETSGLTLIRGREHADQHVEIRYTGEGATSDQLFRNIVDDRARAVFTGAVTVARGIRGTDAEQSVKSLLLSDGASTVARPWLEIHNEHVTAAHGATVGQLDAEALFYLRSRGLSESGARRLLTRAFAGEVVQTISERWRPGVEKLVQGWLDA